MKRKHPPLSFHPTLHGQLEVNWQREYHREFHCPWCETGKMTQLIYNKDATCKLRLGCNSCGKTTTLTKKTAGVGIRKQTPISHHQTLTDILKVNWNEEYQDEYNCPQCHQPITKYYFQSRSIHKLILRCQCCGLNTSLDCQIPTHIYNYLDSLECPNPLCTEIGRNGQKGWVYQKDVTTNDQYGCHFCGIVFKLDSTESNSWFGSQAEDKLLPFNFEDDNWDLRHFFNKPVRSSINFEHIALDWYRLAVKKYLYLLLKSRRYNSASAISNKLPSFRQFGIILQQHQLQQPNKITRQVILSFLDSCQTNNNHTINQKLHNIKDFLEWLELDTSYLIRHRDFLKTRKNDADWLDETTRKGIKQNLSKIPATIARHYLLQKYTAARSGDICQIAFDCLVKENGKWYIKFYQSKVERWHKIPATREIRKIIEQQQQWIRETLGSDYPYLFCHLRAIKVNSYPTFANIKPLPKPPHADTTHNPMVRVIRMLIDREDIRDANGQKPHFTGRITRHSRLQEVRTKYGIEAAQLYADHQSSNTTFQYYAPPTREQVAQVDLPFQKLLMNPDNRFLPWQSLPESLLQNPKAHELDLEIAPRLVVYGHCALDPKTPCPVNLFPKCYGCSSFRPSTGKLLLYERQYQGEQQRLTEAEKTGAELAREEAKATIEAMDKWLPELRRLANG